MRIYIVFEKRIDTVSKPLMAFKTSQKAADKCHDLFINRKEETTDYEFQGIELISG